MGPSGACEDSSDPDCADDECLPAIIQYNACAYSTETCSNIILHIYILNCNIFVPPRKTFSFISFFFSEILKIFLATKENLRCVIKISGCTFKNILAPFFLVGSGPGKAVGRIKGPTIFLEFKQIITMKLIFYLEGRESCLEP